MIYHRPLVSCLLLLIFSIPVSSFFVPSTLINTFINSKGLGIKSSLPNFTVTSSSSSLHYSPFPLPPTVLPPTVLPTILPTILPTLLDPSTPDLNTYISTLPTPTLSSTFSTLSALPLPLLLLQSLTSLFASTFGFGDAVLAMPLMLLLLDVEGIEAVRLVSGVSVIVYG